MSPSIEQWRREAEESQQRAEERRWHRDRPIDYFLRAVIATSAVASAILLCWLIAKLFEWGAMH